MKKNFFLIFLLVILSFHSFGVEGERQGKVVNEEDIELKQLLSDEGVFLIYDCEHGRYMCANEASFNECKINRAKGKELSKSRMPCVPIKDFSVSKDCVDAQYHFIYNRVGFDLCTGRDIVRIIRDRAQTKTKPKAEK